MGTIAPYDVANKEVSTPMVRKNGSKFELLTEESLEEYNLGEVKILKVILGSTPSPLAHVRPNPKKINYGINVGYKVKIGKAPKSKSA